MRGNPGKLICLAALVAIASVVATSAAATASSEYVRFGQAERQLARFAAMTCPTGNCLHRVYDCRRISARRVDCPSQSLVNNEGISVEHGEPPPNELCSWIGIATPSRGHSSSLNLDVRNHRCRATKARRLPPLPHPSARRRTTTISGQLEYVVDGDTLRVDIGEEREYVRLVGIDTPEDVKEGTAVECGARAAARSMERIAPEGATVELRIDPVAGERDTFGRLLAHAFIDGRQLELIQLRRGWAYVYRYHDQHFQGLSKFYAAADQAERADRGVWGKCDGDFHTAKSGTQN